jgi:hypothetical protein
MGVQARCVHKRIAVHVQTGVHGPSYDETVRPIIIVSKFGLQVFMRNLVAQVVAAMGLWSRQQPVHCARSL